MLLLTMSLASALNSTPDLREAAANLQNDPFMASTSPWSSDRGPKIPSNPAQEARMPRVSAQKLRDLMLHDKGMIVVDARDSYSYADSHIPGAVNLPLMSIERLYKTLPKNRLIALYCT